MWRTDGGFRRCYHGAPLGLNNALLPSARIYVLNSLCREEIGSIFEPALIGREGGEAPGAGLGRQVPAAVGRGGRRYTASLRQGGGPLRPDLRPAQSVSERRARRDHPIPG